MMPSAFGFRGEAVTDSKNDIPTESCGRGGLGRPRPYIRPLHPSDLRLGRFASLRCVFALSAPLPLCFSVVTSFLYPLCLCEASRWDCA